MILRPLQKLPNNVGDLGNIIVAVSFECLPKVQKIAKSGHTARHIQTDRVPTRVVNGETKVQ